MSAPLLLGLLFGAGLWLIVMGQPLGRPRPDLPSLLRSFSAQGRIESERRRAGGGPLFRSGLLGRALGPPLEEAGGQLGALLARLGVEPAGLERRLALVWPDLDAPQFRGQQLATGGVLFALFPAMNLAGVQPLGPWPLWLWLLAFCAGVAAPGWQLAARLARRRRAVLTELPQVLDMLAIAASAGLSPEQALLEAGRRSGGTLPAALAEVAREAGLGGAGYAEGLAALADREGVPELRSLADAWRLAQEQGLPLGPTLLALADTVRDRRRARLVEEGGKGSVRMLFPVALFIFPVFLVVLLYPAGVQLLGLGS